MFSYDIEVTWSRDGKRFTLPACVTYRDDEGPDSLQLRMEAIVLAVTEHNLSDFPDDVEGAELVGVAIKEMT